MELRESCKSYGNYLQKTPDILSTLNPFVAIALTSKKGITLFPFSDILKPVHGCFFRRIFLGHRLIFLEFTLSRKIPFIWCNPSELVFEQVSTNTKNRVSFWALRVSFLKRVIETGCNESRFHVFDWTAGNVIEGPLNRDDFYRVIYDTLPRNGEWSILRRWRFTTSIFLIFLFYISHSHDRW